MAVVRLITCPLRAVGCPHDHVNMARYARATPFGADAPMHVQVAVEVEQASSQVEISTRLDDDGESKYGFGRCPV
jgi:hypothetical protein